MNKAIAIIQARMSSKRFPGKVMKPLAGKPLIWHIHRFLERCDNVDKIIIATSKEKSDDVLCNYCNENKFEYFRGSLNNVYSRFFNILRKHNHYEYYARITGDTPLINPRFIDEQIIALNKYDGDLIHCSNPSKFLGGQSIQSTHSLLSLNEKDLTNEDLEHVGNVYISKNPNDFRTVLMNIPKLFDNSDYRVTIDELEDYNLIKKIYKEFPRPQNSNYEKILTWLKKNQNVLLINNNVKDSEINIKFENFNERLFPTSFCGEYSWE